MHIRRAMAQAVTRRPFTAETRVRTRVSPCGICFGQSVVGTGSPTSSVLPVNIIIPWFIILIYHLGDEQ
jgi:hypothetical protein